MAARMFTRGWDFFAPPQAVVYHLWTRGHRASFRQVTSVMARRNITGGLRFGPRTMAWFCSLASQTSVPTKDSPKFPDGAKLKRGYLSE